MAVTDQPTVFTYTATGSATQFAYACRIINDDDLVVQLDGVDLVLDSDYTVSGAGDAGGGAVSFMDAPTGQVRIFRSISPTRSTDYQVAGDFLAPVVNDDFDRLYMVVQDMLHGAAAIPNAVRVPPGEVIPVLPAAEGRALSLLAFDALGNPTTALPAAGTATALGLALMGSSNADVGAGQVGFDWRRAYLPGSVGQAIQSRVNVFKYFTPAQIADVLAYTFLVDVSAAVQAAMTAEGNLYFPPGGYALATMVTVPNTTINYEMTGVLFKGTATTPQSAIVKHQAIHGRLTGLTIWGAFNDNYSTSFWWYCSTGASEYGVVDGLFIYHARSGVTHGALRGSAPGSGFPQSENVLIGYRTRGVQNPYYGNHAQGVLSMVAPQLVSLNNEWPVSPAFDFTARCCVENVAGLLVVNGGQVQQAQTATGYAAKVGGARFLGTIFETAAPIQILGDSEFTGCKFYDTQDNHAQFIVASGATGTLSIVGCEHARLAGVGIYSSSYLIDQTAAAAGFSVQLRGGRSVEYVWPLISKAADGTYSGCYSGFGYRQASTTPLCIIDDARPNLFERTAIDQFGYTTSGWYKTDDSGTGTLSVAVSGPSGNNASSIQVATAGFCNGLTLDASSTANVKATGFRVRPGQKYRYSGAGQLFSGTNARIVARFYDAAAVFVSDVTIAAPSAFAGGAAWGYLSGIVMVPANGAFMGIGIQSNNSSGRGTNFCLQSIEPFN